MVALLESLTGGLIQEWTRVGWLSNWRAAKFLTLIVLVVVVSLAGQCTDIGGVVATMAEVLNVCIENRFGIAVLSIHGHIQFGHLLA